MTDHLMPVFKDEVTKMRKPVWLADIAYSDVTKRPPGAQKQDSSIPAHAWSTLVLVQFHPWIKANETFL
jgi:hypothetical protein